MQCVQIYFLEWRIRNAMIMIGCGGGERLLSFIRLEAEWDNIVLCLLISQVDKRTMNFTLFSTKRRSRRFLLCRASTSGQPCPIKWHVLSESTSQCSEFAGDEWRREVENHFELFYFIFVAHDDEDPNSVLSSNENGWINDFATAISICSFTSSRRSVVNGAFEAMCVTHF